MPSVVFLRGVNVGGANRCRPAAIAKELTRFGVINIGAVGTFVVRKNVDEATLRAAFARKLPFKIEIIIVSAKALLDLFRKSPFARQPSGPNVTHFMNVLRTRPEKVPSLPLSFPSDEDWLLKIIAIKGQFVLGLYRREMKALGYLAKIEKQLGVPASTRSWNTIEKVVKVLQKDV